VEVKKGHDHLQLFSEILLKRLKTGERVEIVIKGYTSPRAKSDYNDNLAKRRISSLRNHFYEWQYAVLEPFLSNGKLVISESPYGESQAETGISDDLFDERNSIYSVGASRERRVEIIEVK
jgi:outer membrane protein OmpA-like peptidoglycan-associated protein